MRADIGPTLAHGPVDGSGCIESPDARSQHVRRPAYGIGPYATTAPNAPAVTCRSAFPQNFPTGASGKGVIPQFPQVVRPRMTTSDHKEGRESLRHSRTSEWVFAGKPLVSGERARRDSNPQPSDP